MEDRTHSGLYLEMTDETPETYAEGRVREVLDWPGVERATWWEGRAITFVRLAHQRGHRKRSY